MDVDGGKGRSGKSLLGASTLSGLDAVIYQDSLVGALYGGSGLELFLVGFRVSGNRWEKSKIVIGLDVDGPAVRTVGAAARLDDTVVVKPAPVLDALGKGKPNMLIGDATHANGVSVVIKAQDPGMGLGVVHPGVTIQRDIRNHVPLVEKPVGRVVIHGTIGKKMLEGDGGIELPDFVQGKDGQNAVVPWGLGNPQINGQIVGTVGSGSGEESIAIEVLLMVAIPSPSCIRIGIAPGALTAVNAFASAITDLDAMMTGPGIVAGAVHGGGELAGIP